MTERAVCFITNSVEGRGAYAIRADNDENVYIPVSVSEALELEEFEEVLALLIKNDRNDPPWRAIRVRRASDI